MLEITVDCCCEEIGGMSLEDLQGVLLPASSDYVTFRDKVVSQVRARLNRNKNKGIANEN